MVDALEVVKDALELTLRHLEEHLVLFLALRAQIRTFVVSQVKLHVEDRLSHSRLRLRRDLEVKPPIKVVEAVGAREVLLNVLLTKWGGFAHALEQ